MLSHALLLLIPHTHSSRAKSLVKDDPRAALKPYGQLAKLTQLTIKSSPLECNKELIAYMVKRQTTLWEELKDILSESVIYMNAENKGDKWC